MDLTKYVYTIVLPDGNKVILWFLGKQLEIVLKAYNIKYEKKEIK